MSFEHDEKTVSKDHSSSSTEAVPYETGSGKLSGAELAQLRGAGNVLTRIYRMPRVQVAMLGFIFFLCPGMFNALSGLGGGGQIDPTTNNNASIALYATFCVAGLFAGTFVNRLGPRIALCVGALGYTLYMGSFASFNNNGSGGFVVAAGAILGVCAGLIWAAQGAIMLALPTEAQKGRFISIFWVIFNTGAVLGGGIELGLAYDNPEASISTKNYYAFMALSIVGAIVALCMMSPRKVVRDDGTRIHASQLPGWASEVRGLYTVLRFDPWVFALLPTFFVSNFYYTWQFNNYNGVLFNLRTRSLNSLVYWASQMVAALLLGALLDSHRLRRKTRAWLGLAALTVMVWSVWPGSYVKQLQYSRTVKLDPMDFSEDGFAPLIILYVFMGFFDAMWQCYALYIIGTLSNDMDKLAHLAGLWKSVQSAGAAIAYAVDRDHAPFMNQLAANWAMSVFGLICFAIVIRFRVKDHTEETHVEERIQGTVTDEKDA